MIVPATPLAAGLIATQRFTENAAAWPATALKGFRDQLSTTRIVTIIL